MAYTAPILVALIGPIVLPEARSGVALAALVPAGGGLAVVVFEPPEAAPPESPPVAESPASNNLLQELAAADPGNAPGMEATEPGRCDPLSNQVTTCYKRR